LRHLTVALSFALALTLTGFAASAGAADSVVGASDGGPASGPDLALGRSIYEQGVGADGQPVAAQRLGVRLDAHASACLSCHRPSGMGQVEADVQVPPINGTYLFAPPREHHFANMDPRVSKLFNQMHDPYSTEAVARALRSGTAIGGRTLNPAMPRYSLDDHAVESLVLYLKQLSVKPSEGVTDTEIHLATVVTPDVDPQRRKLFIDMMRIMEVQKNGSTVPTTAIQSRTRHHMVSAAEFVLGTEHKWVLHIWEPQGAPETWGAQLDAFNAAQPVYALVSGLGDQTWQPVDDFCTRQKIPCWFPSVDAPPQKVSPYSLYLSRGVGLESELLAQFLKSKGKGKRPGRVVQVLRRDQATAIAAEALTQALAGTSIGVDTRVLGQGDLGKVLPAALKNLKPDDVLMFWLRPADLSSLAVVNVPRQASYFSARLGKVTEHPLPQAWARSANWIYPYELPQDRVRNLDYFHIWLNSHKLPRVDEAMQSEVYFSVNFLTDTLSDMLENLYRDYLVERAESFISFREAVKSEQETRDRVALGYEGDLSGKKGAFTQDPALRVPLPDRAKEGIRASHGTTMYHQLSLAPGQRFAAKGGYVVRHDEQGDLKAVSELLVP